jgi:hypothetical protein
MGEQHPRLKAGCCDPWHLPPRETIGVRFEVTLWSSEICSLFDTYACVLPNGGVRQGSGNPPEFRPFRGFGNYEFVPARVTTMTESRTRDIERFVKADACATNE